MNAWSLPEAADNTPTFFAHALSLAAMHGPGPWPRGGYPLPDQPPDRRRPLMSGAVLDGVRTHHARHRPDSPTAATIADLLQTLVTHPPVVADLHRLHDLLAGQSTLDIADALTQEIRHRDLPSDRLRLTGRWLVEHGTRRGTVAAGIVLIGLTGDERDRELLLLVSALEDLTLYAVVALLRSQADPERAIFELARRVDGWGRIHAVERLRGTQDPKIRAWLLREGFRNSIMDEYLAHLAATTGGLHDALSTPPVEDALLDGAGGILTALCAGGPAKGMNDYPDGPATIDRYLALVGNRPPTLPRVAVVLSLARYLTSRSAAEPDWDDDIQHRLASACERLTGQPRWRVPVEDALKDPDLATFRSAIWPARQLDIPTRDYVRSRLRTNRNDGYLWQSLTDDIDDVLDLAEELLPLDELAATGPSEEIGLGAGQPDHVLDLLVSRLHDHPGKGWPLIRAALSNRMIRNRNMAIRALKAWPTELISDEAIDAVRHASEIEPDDGVRERLRQLLGDGTRWNASSDEAKR